MPRKKTGLFDNRAYQNEYHRNMKRKLIAFNPSNAEDMRLLEYLESKKNQTAYIKNLIREDMKQNQ